MQNVKENPNCGVIVGRFQVPELHDGHMELFRAVRARHQKVIVFVGVSAMGTATQRNPLDFETRRRMIQAKFPEFSVHPLKDFRTDEEWGKALDASISVLVPWGEVTLYGARDSFVPRYKGKYVPVELELAGKKISGTEIRAELTNAVMESYDFRAGQIYALSNKRPHVDVTVDVAILHKTENGEVHVLLAEKAGFSGLRFVGGFVEGKRFGLEEDARREVFEETGLDVSGLAYISSRAIEDWRYVDEKDTIKSVFYVAWSMTLGGKAQDDVERVGWYHLSELEGAHMVLEHRGFHADLLKYVATLKKDEETKREPRSEQSASASGQL